MQKPTVYISSAIGSGQDEKFGSFMDVISIFLDVINVDILKSNVDHGKTSAEVFQQDSALIAKADCFLMNGDKPSIGTGYWLAKAEQRGIPCIVLCTDPKKVSFTVSGNPRNKLIDVSSFDAFSGQFALFMSEQFGLYRPAIWITGPPGSGKGTVAKRLCQLFGLRHISTGEELRALVDAMKMENNYQRPANNPFNNQEMEIIIDCMDAGKLIPSHLMTKFVLSFIGDPKIIAQGYILDGYPSSNDDLKNLMGYYPDLILQLNCDELIAVARQMERSDRKIDESKAKSRYDRYVSSIPTFSDMGVPIAEFDGHQDRETVYEQMKTVVEGYIHCPPKKFTFQPKLGVLKNSTRFHMHVDAPYQTLMRIIAKIEERNPSLRGQTIIYPISSLRLCGQIIAGKFPETYGRLPNFKSFIHSTNEAFATINFGDNLDVSLVRSVVQICSKIGNCMTELEEYIQINNERYLPLKIDLKDLDGPNRLPNPKYEYHHGFNLPKNGIVDENEFLREAEVNMKYLDVGGIFIFANQNVLKIRTNSFSNEFNGKRLKKEQEFLKRYYPNAELECSLEIVHGMWVFPADS